MKKQSLSDVKAQSLKYAKDGNNVFKIKEVQSIQERVDKNFDEFKRIKWLNARNSSREHRKGAQ